MMFCCVQDLTCPGASLAHSVGLAARVPGVTAVEANARRYVPIANKAWDGKFPGIFLVKDRMTRNRELEWTWSGSSDIVVRNAIPLLSSSGNREDIEG